jgi:hypothetical protein
MMRGPDGSIWIHMHLGPMSGGRGIKFQRNGLLFNLAEANDEAVIGELWIEGEAPGEMQFILAQEIFTAQTIKQIKMSASRILNRNDFEAKEFRQIIRNYPDRIPADNLGLAITAEGQPVMQMLEQGHTIIGGLAYSMDWHLADGVPQPVDHQHMQQLHAYVLPVSVIRLIQAAVKKSAEFAPIVDIAAKFIFEQFGKDWQIALAMLSNVLHDQARWPFIQRMKAANLPIAIMQGLLNLGQIRFEEFPNDYQALVLSNSASNSGLTTDDLDDLWILYTHIYPDWQKKMAVVSPAFMQFHSTARPRLVKDRLKSFDEKIAALKGDDAKEEFAVALIKGQKRKQMKNRETFVHPDFLDNSTHLIDVPGVLRGPLTQGQVSFDVMDAEGGFGKRFVMRLSYSELIGQLHQQL